MMQRANAVLLSFAMVFHAVSPCPLQWCFTRFHQDWWNRVKHHCKGRANGSTASSFIQLTHTKNASSYLVSVITCYATAIALVCFLANSIFGWFWEMQSMFQCEICDLPLLTKARRVLTDLPFCSSSWTPHAIRYILLLLGWMNPLRILSSKVRRARSITWSAVSLFLERPNDKGLRPPALFAFQTAWSGLWTMLLPTEFAEFTDDLVDQSIV